MKRWQRQGSCSGPKPPTYVAVTNAGRAGHHHGLRVCVSACLRVCVSACLRVCVFENSDQLHPPRNPNADPTKEVVRRVVLVDLSDAPETLRTLG